MKWKGTLPPRFSAIHFQRFLAFWHRAPAKTNPNPKGHPRICHSRPPIPLDQQFRLQLHLRLLVVAGAGIGGKVAAPLTRTITDPFQYRFLLDAETIELVGGVPLELDDVPVRHGHGRRVIWREILARTYACTDCIILFCASRAHYVHAVKRIPLRVCSAWWMSRMTETLGFAKRLCLFVLPATNRALF